MTNGTDKCCFIDEKCWHCKIYTTRILKFQTVFELEEGTIPPNCPVIPTLPYTEACEMEKKKIPENKQMLRGRKT